MTGHDVAGHEVAGHEVTEILMPRVGPTMEDGRVIRWLKAEGDLVRAGEEIVEIETEKTNVVVEAPQDGVLLYVRVGADTVAPVGAVIGVIGAPGEHA